MRIASLAALLALPLLAACVPQEPPKTDYTSLDQRLKPLDCPTVSRPALEVAFYLGRKTGDGGRFSGPEYDRFLNEVVTPNFPEGLTTWDADGRDSNYVVGKTYSEGSKVLILIVFDQSNIEQRIQNVADAYKQRAKQDAVLVITEPVCYALR